MARRGKIYLKNYNKKLKYYVLYDDVTTCGGFCLHLRDPKASNGGPMEKNWKDTSTNTRLYSQEVLELFKGKM